MRGLRGISTLLQHNALALCVAFAESEVLDIILIRDSIFSGKLHKLDIKHCPLTKLTDSLHYQDTRISMGRQRGPAILDSIRVC